MTFARPIFEAFVPRANRVAEQALGEAMNTRILAVAALAATLLAGCSHHHMPPPPPPPPPPPVALWDAVTVYFDYEKANLTAAAASAVADALGHHGRLPRHETVTGYCDTAEHRCHDLAIRRAEAVKDELIRLGMAASDIETYASDDLAVSTGRHMREPQNRRAVIDPR